MKSGVLENIAPVINFRRDIAEQKAETIDQKGFFSYFQDALHEVDGLQKQAQLGAEKLIVGGQDYLHNTTIAYEKANLALQLTIEVRNKLLDAYQEIMRIQM